MTADGTTPPPSPLIIGLDVGSTTVKAIVLEPASCDVLWQEYRRHETRQAETARNFLVAIEEAFPEHAAHGQLHLFVTGSGGGGLAECLGARFVQEVHAVSLAVERLFPDVGSVVELGGQDAKIIVFKDLGGGTKKKLPSMNDKCAGGTGAVIDKIADKLSIPAAELGAMGYTGRTIHPVAGKCGVFAETDINSLQKQGVSAEELMASLFESIVQQNLSVLTRGHTLRPTVLLLGGPNTYIRGLQECWRHHITQIWRERGIEIGTTATSATAPTTPAPQTPEEAVLVPERAQYFAALGAAELGRQELEDQPGVARYPGRKQLDWYIAEGQRSGRSAHQIAPLVRSHDDLTTFLERYRPPPWQPAAFRPGERVRAFIGIDAGSTSTKGVLLGADAEVVAKAYQLSQGNPIEDAIAIIAELEGQISAQGARLEIIGVGTTGYAKDIIRDVVQADTALVETVAHAHACQHFYPGTDVIVDVGGQDIKLMFLREGRVRDFRLNTQCSAGNGYFLQATARAFGYAVEEYADIAFSADAMPDFNHGCAVFLQSDIVDFQRKGWRANEILAGLAAVLPKNIWLYVAQIANPAELGERFVLQGGTQRNLAAVKAQVDDLKQRFERLGRTCDIQVHRHCGESGAIGAALEARVLFEQGRRTRFIGLERTRHIRHRTIRNEQTRCYFCKNLCLRTFIDVAAGAEQPAAEPPPLPPLSAPGTGNDQEGQPGTAPKTPKIPIPEGYQRLIVATCEKGEVEDVAAMRRIKANLDEVVERNPNFPEIAAQRLFQAPVVESVADPQPRGLIALLRPRYAARRRRAQADRGEVRIGIPRVLNLYACAPFFLGFFTALGVPARNIVFSDYTDQELYRRGATRGSIDPCFPSKLGIPHVHNLLYGKHKRRALTHIFFPMIHSLPSTLEGVMSSMACPTVVATAESTHAAFVREGDLFAEHGIDFKKTLLNLHDPRLAARQMFADWGETLGLSVEEAYRATRQGLRAIAAVEEELRQRQRTALDMLEREGRIGIGVLGRPYHNDPGINHGILDELQRKGYPIFWQDALPDDRDLLDRLFGGEVRRGEVSSALAIDDVWKHDFSEHSSRKLWAAKFIARHPNLVAVELSSFKCGHDAPIYAVIEEIIERSGTPYFCFKDLDENRPAGSIQIRTETIDYFLQQHADKLRPRALAA
ncbi:CoA activase [Halorhodospira abdelmalekii]|uniref:BadF/BadG/BcrA/BcrD ATPase family protein n=1 Tax=Halorhodospira abdelmalekii TaxID=421629 RepID=UPI0019079A47|nr:BadF/BadG/BcrA/BcrD ATPase family protein [Halorhodospira abdelmalekii]MBK1735100.1 CoA activase [Halorhodospira abdelmalekii]